MDSTPIILNPSRVEEELTSLFRRDARRSRPAKLLDEATRRPVLFASVGALLALVYSTAFASMTGDAGLAPILSTSFVFSVAGGLLGLPPTPTRRRMLLLAFAAVGLLLGLTAGTLLCV